MREGEAAPPWHLAGIRVAPVLSNRTGDEAPTSFCSYATSRSRVAKMHIPRYRFFCALRAILKH